MNKATGFQLYQHTSPLEFKILSNEMKSSLHTGQAGMTQATYSRMIIEHARFPRNKFGAGYPDLRCGKGSDR